MFLEFLSYQGSFYPILAQNVFLVLNLPLEKSTNMI